MNRDIPSVGVEEEYQLVNPESGCLIPNCKQVMRQLGKNSDADIQHELHLNQIEMASAVCNSLDEIRRSLQQVRGQLIDAAGKTGAALVSAGTNAMPLPEDESLTPKKRYRMMTQRFQQLARELFIFGCHVHVAMDDRKLGVRVMNQSRRWLPILQALTANSPYWDGADTGYSSYRRELWVQWPMAGPPPHFHDFADYESCIRDLKKSEAISDESFIYWDIRLSTKVPTIEFRGADVMMSLEETVGYVGLVRAIVMRASADIAAQQTNRPIRENVLSHAIWHAARYGISEDLVDPLTCEKMPAREMANDLIAYVRPCLEVADDFEAVSIFIDGVFREGNGADRQRKAVAESDKLEAAVRRGIVETSGGTLRHSAK